MEHREYDNTLLIEIEHCFSQTDDAVDCPFADGGRGWPASCNHPDAGGRPNLENIQEHMDRGEGRPADCPLRIGPVLIVEADTD